MMAEARRQRSDPRVLRRYAVSNPAAFHTRHQTERNLVRELHRRGLMPLHDKRILDVGCGSGGWLLTLAQFGAAMRAAYGIDVDEPRLSRSRARNPGLHLLAADASELPFPSASFDLLTQFTAFTSMLDSETRRRAALEMQRVLRPKGAILWYDFFLPSPWSATRAIGLGEIRELFPGFQVDALRVTLLPPLARRVAPISPEAALLLERISLLRSHYLALMRRKDDL